MLASSEPWETPPGALQRRQSVRREEDRRLSRRDSEVEAARRISEALFQKLHADDLVEQALQTALDAVGAASGSILLADTDTKQLVFRHSIGVTQVAAGTTMPWTLGIAGEVYRSGTPLVIVDASCDPRHFPGIDELIHHITHDMIALPLKRWEGDPIGVLEVLDKRHGKLNQNDLSILTIISAMAAAAIEQSRLYQEAKLAEVARVLGNISHDIKNLLMPVVCGTDLLDSEVKDLISSTPGLSQEKAQASIQMCEEVLSMVKSSTHRIQDHMKQIADCVKGRTSPPQFAPCNVAKVVESVFETVRWLAKEREVDLRAVGLEVLPTLVADERQLFNALYNLVNNALPEVATGGHVTLSGEYRRQQNEICIRVIDNGRGMPPEVRDSLFTPRVKSRKTGGTGLGTKIVKDVVDAHRGSVTVESEVNVGTTFSLHFPCQAVGS